ncbi:putative Ni/Fe-hydrogenase 2 b-type cytochrome subunit [bacterium BMS3Abin05]|nr:putative Ni/Fe-hydrogenase 2 b-type cytochrome subunit [bacterium BMS3Abin05]
MMNSIKLESVFKITFWKVVVVILWIFGIYAAYVRFFHGLGYATNLSDRFPWGLWIGFDVISGVGLGAGGFTLTALVVVFNIKKLRPILRATILTAFLGYIMVIIGLGFDLGKWYYVWHTILFWNEHSPMFELAWCVMLYTTILFLEFSVNFFERIGWTAMVKIHHWFTPVLVSLGVMFSVGHQSTLGSIYLIMPEKLYPFWYTPWLPVLFFVSSVMVAFAMTIFESYMSARAFHRELELGTVRLLARILVFMIAFYLVMRLETLWSEGAFKYLKIWNTETAMFLIEIIIGVIVPFVMLCFKKIRNDKTYIFFSSVLVILGFVMNRLNVALTGTARAAGGFYFPSWMEIVTTLSLIALGFALFGLAARYFNIFPEGPLEEVEKKLGPKAKLPQKPIVDISYKAISILGIVIILGLLAVVLGIKHQKQVYSQPVIKKSELNPLVIRHRQEVKLPGDYTFPMGKDSPGPVLFSHDSHYDYDNPNCASCHPVHFDMLAPGRSPEGPITMETMDKGKNCGACHNGKTAFDTKDPDNCSNCHQMQ